MLYSNATHKQNPMATLTNLALPLTLVEKQGTPVDNQFCLLHLIVQLMTSKHYPTSYSSLMTIHHTEIPTNSEFYSLPAHSHIFCDLWHCATFMQPSSCQPATPMTTWSMALKHMCNALTHLSHDAMTHQGHDEPPDTHQSMSAMPTQAIQHLQIKELFQWPSYWDTEAPKGSQDAGPLGLHQHLGVEDQKAQPWQWDTKMPLGSWDADPPGSQHPWIDDSLTHYLTTGTLWCCKAHVMLICWVHDTLGLMIGL